MDTKRTGNLFALAAVLCALGLAGPLRGGTEEGKGVGMLRTAFIDVNKVLNANKGLRAVEEKLSTLHRNGRAELDKLKEEIDDLQNELSLLRPDSPEYWQGKCELDRKELAAKQRQQEILLQRDRMLSDALRKAYKEVEEAVRKYAREKGLQAVFTGNADLDRLETHRPQDLIDWISMVDVVWHDDRLDISDAVINIMNGP